MYIVLIENTVKEDCVKEYVDVSKQFMDDMKTLPGLVDAKVWCDTNNPAQVLDVMIWESKEASSVDDGSIFLKYKADLRPHFITNTTRTFSC